jgi:hypothetical protein
MEPSAVAALTEFKTYKPKLNQEMAELLEACGVALAMGGGPTMAYVPLVLEYLEEHP